MRRPTSEELERHAARFGPEGVAETAELYGLKVEVATPRSRSRKRGPTLRQRVARLVEAGHSVEVIAEMEDLSPARARRLVNDVKGKA